jgi:hypothetical protein
MDNTPVDPKHTHTNFVAPEREGFKAVDLPRAWIGPIRGVSSPVGRGGIGGQDAMSANEIAAPSYRSCANHIASA